ncbi:MAG: cyclic pyranopterin phosphate synthase MoaA [Synechococcus sp. MED850]|jgi:cyclic pyranopterin phosphate synthase|nr:cyclic pyranopterin phosphate synthase MoaA [Synechococcus sp. MED850]OUW97498.1 MAG: cyclic pyranopterin phosphate synthase MoaA [Cyanobacteria bacterium TMED229]
MTVLDSSRDRLGRPLGVLRLSLTARCNLACTYCRPDNVEPQIRLDCNDQLALIRTACALGVRSLRLTGGEPLLSDRLLPLLEAVSAGRCDPRDPLSGLDEVAITTNGVLLTRERATALMQSGLNRITVSLDAATGQRFGAMTGMPERGSFLLDRVMAGLEAARDAGFDPSCGALKLNSVIQRHVNDDQIIPLARLARRLGVELRLIEFMDVGQRNGWRPHQVISAAEMVARVHQQWPLVPLGRSSSATARRWTYKDGCGVLGVIASITEPFCGDCNRLRITVDGMAFTCLFSGQGTDLKPWLKPALDCEGLHRAMAGLWQDRSDRFSEERTRQVGLQPRAEMAYLGG